MKTKKEIIKSVTYWVTLLQNELYRQLKFYMVENGYNQNDIARKLKVTKGHISQILNGNSNFTLRKLITLAVSIGKVPIIRFVNQKAYLLNELKIEQFFQGLDNDISQNVPTFRINLTEKSELLTLTKSAPVIIRPDINKGRYTQKITAN